MQPNNNNNNNASSSANTTVEQYDDDERSPLRRLSMRNRLVRTQSALLGKFLTKLAKHKQQQGQDISAPSAANAHSDETLPPLPEDLALLETKYAQGQTATRSFCRFLSLFFSFFFFFLCFFVFSWKCVCSCVGVGNASAGSAECRQQVACCVVLRAAAGDAAVT